MASKRHGTEASGVIGDPLDVAVAGVDGEAGRNGLFERRTARNGFYGIAGRWIKSIYWG
jgi:hypothetical protein